MEREADEGQRQEEQREAGAPQPRGAQAGEECPGRGQVGAHEEDPRGAHHQHRPRPAPQPLQRGRPPRRVLAARAAPVEQELVESQGGPVDGAPEDVAPRRAVPEPAEDHGQEQVEEDAGLPAAGTAERVVDEVAQPPAEGHVPAPPEVADAGRRVGVVEVVGDLDAEQQRAAAHEVHVAGEVAVDLRGVADERHPQRRRRVVLGRLEDVADAELEQQRRDHHPLEQARQDEGDGEGQLLDAGRRPRLDLRQQVAAPADGTDQQLGEERHEQREVGEALRPRPRPAVDLDEVGDGLEGVERDADGQDDLRNRQAGAEAEGEGRVVDRFGEEDGVLEPGQRREVRPHRDREPAASPGPRLPADDAGQQVVADHGEGQQPHEVPAVAAVEPRARRDQEQLLRRARRLERPEGGERQQQEQQELGGFEGHRTRWMARWAPMAVRGPPPAPAVVLIAPGRSAAGGRKPGRSGAPSSILPAAHAQDSGHASGAASWGARPRSGASPAAGARASGTRDAARGATGARACGARASGTRDAARGATGARACAAAPLKRPFTGSLED